MKVLIIGGGGREHALAWKAAQSPKVQKVYVAPGNAGSAHEPKTENIPLAAEDIQGLLGFAKTNKIDLTIVGPETPLVLGAVDYFQAAGLRCFGPTQAAAQLEGSKSFAKDFLARHRIPTAAYATFTDADTAMAYIRQHQAPWVIKADGLAAGKGVIIAQAEAEAIQTVKNILEQNAFGAAGRRIIIEQLLVGEEASFIVMVDGKNVLPLATSQDHKRRDDGERGPNTGGMGAYSPAAVVTPALHAHIMHEVIEPTVHGIAQEGRPYTGFLYAGLMITADGAPRVLEYNCRFGDPESQPIMMRLQTDLIELIEAALAGKLDRIEARWDPRPALGVVMAAQGYPGSYHKGDIIHGLPADSEADRKVFHAGTLEKNGAIVAYGGRVLCVTALGKSVSTAQARAYGLVNQISWKGAFYRRDIGFRAIERERGARG